MTTDLYIQILHIVEGDFEKANKIKKLIDNLTDDMLKIIIDMGKGSEQNDKI